MRLIALTAMVFSTVLIKGLGAKPVLAQTQTLKNAQNRSTESSPKKPKNYIIKIKSGDTLEKIAKVHKSTYQRIFYANKEIKSPDLIYPGQKIVIPSAKEKLKNRDIPGYNVASVPTTTVHNKVAKSSSRVVTVPVQQGTGTGVWDKLAQCEAGGNWGINTGNGYYGGLQFTLSSWRAVGGSGYPNQASRAEQIARGKILQSRQGWGAWPACTAKLGIN